MATLLDSPLTFFSKATPEQFAFVLGQYREVFKKHAQETRGAKKTGPAELIKLDNWFQDTLPQLIKARKDKHLFYEEIVQITKWKLLRGKFRPSLLDLVKTNTETAIKNVTKKAFKKMPNISAAITALTQLKGIAPSTASAILVAHSPNLCPYMAEENMASTPGVEESDLSISEYLNYVDQTNICVERLRAQDTKTDWTPHKVELAIWTYYQCKQYNSNLLDNMPLANGESIEIKEDEKQSNGKLDDQDELSNESKQISNGDVNSNSEADENSNQSIEQQNHEEQSEINENLTNGMDSQLSKSNGHMNGNGFHGDESNLSAPSVSSSENEDKSNDSMLNNKHEEDSSSQLNQYTVSSSVDNTASVEEPQLNEESSVQPQLNNDNQMEVESSETSATIQEKNKNVINEKVEELNNHLNNNLEKLNNDNSLTDSSVNSTINNKLVVEKEQINLVHNNNHCNGTLENGIKNVFKSAVDSIKDNLISSSEENSNNNLSEENSNLSGSNLSYTDLHSTSDNAIDDGPALKRIRVE